MKQLETNQTDATICFISRGNGECTLETLEKFLPERQNYSEVFDATRAIRINMAKVSGNHLHVHMQTSTNNDFFY